MHRKTPKRPAQASDAARDGNIPVRQCVGCRNRAEKRQLLRFVRAGDGWAADPGAERDGRGAYLCSPQCMERVKKNKKYKGLATVTVAARSWPTTTKEGA